MKKISLQQKEIFEIANFIKNNFPAHKVYLHKFNNRLTLKFCSRVERFKLEEIKTLLKIRYPYLELIIFQGS